MEEDAFFLAGPGARDDGIAPQLRLSTAPASDR